MKRGGGWKREGKLKRGGWKREKLVHLPLFLLHNVGLVQDLTKCVEELGGIKWRRLLYPDRYFWRPDKHFWRTDGHFWRTDRRFWRPKECFLRQDRHFWNPDIHFWRPDRHV